MDKSKVDLVNFLSFAASSLTSGRINSKDEDSNTALHKAASKTDVEWVKFFLARGALTDVVNKFGDTPLHVAAKSNEGDSHYDVLAELMSKLKDTNLKNLGGFSPFHLVLLKSSKKVVELFLDSGASMIETDGVGRSPLLLGALKGDPEVLRLLINRIRSQLPVEAVKNRDKISEAARLSGNLDCITLIMSNLY